jgi:hypothetical protein
VIQEVWRQCQAAAIAFTAFSPTRLAWRGTRLYGSRAYARMSRLRDQVTKWPALQNEWLQEAVLDMMEMWYQCIFTS